MKRFYMIMILLVISSILFGNVLPLPYTQDFKGFVNMTPTGWTLGAVGTASIAVTARCDHHNSNAVTPMLTKSFTSGNVNG